MTAAIETAQTVSVIAAANTQTNPKIHEAFCDVCSEQATGTFADLRGEGWGIYISAGY